MKSKQIIKDTKNKKVIYFEEQEVEIIDIYLGKLIETARRNRFLSNVNSKKAKKIKWKGNDILHRKNKSLKIDEEITLEIINNLITIIEKLYK